MFTDGRTNHWMEQWMDNIPSCTDAIDSSENDHFSTALRTNQWTDQPTDGPIDGRTYPLIEMQELHLKTQNLSHELLSKERNSIVEWINDTIC